MFLLLTQPQGDQLLVNLDNVLRIFPADRGGTGVVFHEMKNGNLNAVIFKESFDFVHELLKKAGRVL